MATPSKLLLEVVVLDGKIKGNDIVFHLPKKLIHSMRLRVVFPFSFYSMWLVKDEYRLLRVDYTSLISDLSSKNPWSSKPKGTTMFIPITIGGLSEIELLKIINKDNNGKYGILIEHYNGDIKLALTL